MNNGTRVLNETEVGAVSGAGRTAKDGSYVPGNAWERFMYDAMGIGLVNDGTGYGGSNMRIFQPADGRPA
jgi:hypothetical protein